MDAITPEVFDLEVEIVRFVAHHQPNIVACEFIDANGGVHTLIEKAPIVSDKDLDADCGYPLRGSIRCVVLNRWRDDTGRELASISTHDPDHIESIGGLSEFVVL